MTARQIEFSTVSIARVRAEDIPAEQIRRFGEANGWKDRVSPTLGPTRGSVEGSAVKSFDFRFGSPTAQASWTACMNNPACLASAVETIKRRLEIMYFGRPVVVPRWMELSAIPAPPPGSGQTQMYRY